jgi:Fur family ferric uptake transcriptional regulator
MRRDTRQRRAIRRVFLETGRPLAPADVLREAQRHATSLGIATVYRNLKDLIDEGWLTAVDLPGESTRYELSERPHHHHFVCRSCAQAFDLHACPSGVESLAPEGFRVEAHEVVLYGICAACR